MVIELAAELEAAWQHAYAGREVAERDSVLRELHRLLQPRQPTREPVRLRLIDGRAGADWV
jgi:hypothetical protein